MADEDVPEAFFAQLTLSARDRVFAGHEGAGRSRPQARVVDPAASLDQQVPACPDLVTVEGLRPDRSGGALMVVSG